MERGVLVQTGSWPGANFSGRATRRNISEQLHLWESNHTAHARFDALLENCVFYISRMYEFRRIDILRCLRIRATGLVCTSQRMRSTRSAGRKLSLTSTDWTPEFSRSWSL